MNIELTPQILYIIFFLSVYNGILLGLTIAVYYQNRRSLTNRYFAIFLFIIIFWFNLTFIYSNLFLLPHIFYPLGLIAGTFLAPAFYFFSRHLTNETYRVRNPEYLGFIPLVVIVIYNFYRIFTPKFRESIKEIIKVVDGTIYKKADWVYYLYTIYLFAGIFIGLFFIVRGIRKESDRTKKKLLIYIILPIVIGFLISVLYINILAILKLPVNMTIPYITITIALIFVGFSLLRHRAWTIEYMMDLISEKEEKIALSYEELKSLDKMKSDFFTNLSHEMKTPLTLISNYLDEYLKDKELSKELKIVKQNIDKLLVDMINFFDILKFQKGLHIYYHDKIINLSDFLKVKGELFTPIAMNQKITITENIEENVFIKIDPTALDRIINNIIENAIRYNKDEGKIEITLKSVNDKLEFIVRDTGIGMDKDQLDKIFLPYYQISHKKSNIQGIGMGLSIVKNIINDINGDIFVESRLNEGSSFKIIFERYLPKEDDVIYTQVEKFYPTISFPASEDPCREEVINEDNYNILIVEDNREILYLIKDKMKDSYNVYCALSGIEALKKLENMPVPDVIVSDIMMDNMDGYQLFDSIQNMNGYNDIPFIFITAKTTIDEKIKALKKGAIDFIFKPFVIDELISKIDALIKFQELKKVNFEKEKFASIGMLLGGISHEIYNPLSGITGPLDNIKKSINKRKILDKNKINKYISYIEKSAQRIESIIKNVRALYKKEKFAKEKLNINEIVNSVFEDYKIDPGNKIDFEAKIDKSIEVFGDKNALYQILNNLMSNAVDSINKINGQGKISIILEKSNNNKIIRIIDNGSGIMNKDMDKIFNAFYTTKSIGNNIGLGLYIVKDLIIKLGWEIKVNSEEGKGATISIFVKD